MNPRGRHVPPRRFTPWLNGHFTRAAIQGAPYSNSYNGWHALAEGHRTEAVSYGTLHEAFAALRSGEVDVGYIPIANTIAQQVPDVMRLIRDSNVKIIDEAIRQIDHCVVGMPGADISKTREVRSHKVALGQCEGWLKRHPHLSRIEWYDTAGAAQDIASEGDPGIIAIAPKETAEAFGLEVLAEGIQDVNPNQTRFVVLAPMMYDYANDDQRKFRTALLVQLRNTGGGAYTNDAHLTLAFADADHRVLEKHAYIGMNFRVPQVYYEVQSRPGRSLGMMLSQSRYLFTSYKVIGCFPEAQRM